MHFAPEDITSRDTCDVFSRLGDRWVSVLEHPCSFPPGIFEDVTSNLLQNPNINSSLLFRADILYDSLATSRGALSDADEPAIQASSRFMISQDDFQGFSLKRTVVRRLIPRNPQLDKPIAQTCQTFQSNAGLPGKHTAVIYIPHVSSSSEIPWYHPKVHSLAYLHTWQSSDRQSEVLKFPGSLAPGNGNCSIHYRLFPEDPFCLPDRLSRTAHHLLSTLHKHGQGTLDGYKKHVHHDLIISQRRVQDTYTRLKAAHARRLCDHWAEQTDSSKHVFEDLSISAFLIELWRDMYRLSGSKPPSDRQADPRPEFPGFVDIGCGNGVLVDILVREGFEGWGFDARARKSWAIFEASTQRRLYESILIPQVLLDASHDITIGTRLSPPRLLSKVLPKTRSRSKEQDINIKWHNGIFPQGTFIISNHADELTPWTPLLAYISMSPFLVIPCCSHNLSGLRFRAPSKFNGYTADAGAPLHFQSCVTRSKSVAITTAADDQEDDQPRSGNLKNPGQGKRGKQSSAYAALCDWVSALAMAMGYEVEKEILRLPSTRNTALVGRKMVASASALSPEQRIERVGTILLKEGADGKAWVERAKGLMAGKGQKH